MSIMIGLLLGALIIFYIIAAIFISIGAVISAFAPIVLWLFYAVMAVMGFIWACFILINIYDKFQEIRRHLKLKKNKKNRRRMKAMQK